jgi:hypothetical protein
MNNGSKITGYTGTSSTGLIYVNSSTSSFVMNGGEISGNQHNAGIVRIASGATFTMNDGTIKGNTVSLNACIVVDSDSFFVMYGGTITGNTNTNANCGTGGVFVAQKGNFSMHGGSITNNTANATTGANNRNGAGGVYIHGNASGVGFFYMYGGSVTGNISPMGDVYNAALFFGGVNLLAGNATVGTLTSINANATAALVALILSGNDTWTGSVQVLNLYSDNTNFTSVANAFIDRPIIRISGSGTLTSADIDKFKKFNFLNSNLVEQDISLQGKGIVKSGAKIGYMTP